MAERFLIDTSAIIKYLNEIFPTPGISFLDKVLNEESSISFITEIELQVWAPPNPEDIKIYFSFVEHSNLEIKFFQNVIRTGAVFLCRTQVISNR